MSETQLELRRLRRRVAELEAEREIARRLAVFDTGPVRSGAGLYLHQFRGGQLSMTAEN